MTASSRASARRIANRLGRSPATVKAYFYDRSNANKRPTYIPTRYRRPRRAARRVRRLPGHKVAPGLSRAERTPPWRGGAALRPIPAGARAYARGATCARTGRGTPAPLRYGTPRPTAPPVGRCLQSPPDALRASGRYEARVSGTGGRRRLDTLTRRLLVELNASGYANRTNLPTARRVGRRRRAGLPQPREAAA